MINEERLAALDARLAKAAERLTEQLEDDYLREESSRRGHHLKYRGHPLDPRHPAEETERLRRW